MANTIAPVGISPLGAYTQTGRPSGGAVGSFAELMNNVPQKSPADSIQGVGDILRTSETMGVAYLQGKTDSTTLTRATTEAGQALELLKSLTEKIVEGTKQLNQML